MRLEIVRDIGALARWQRIEAACCDHDHVALPADPLADRVPSLDPATGDGGEQTLFLLGFTQQEPIGAVEITLPTKDNLTAATVNVSVLPAYRRRGHGRELLAGALDQARLLGRTRVFFEAPSPFPLGPGAAESLLRSVGARPVLREVRRLLALGDSPSPPPPPPPAGYALVPWSDLAPEEYVPDLAHLMSRMSVDAPLGDMDWEPEVWDAARYRGKEQTALARGRTSFATLVVHQASQRVVGFTDVGLSRHAPQTTFQWETIVQAGHRGHGLGLVLQAHNHQQLRERSGCTRWLNTWNAESNTYMVSINERLGFRPVECWTEWQLDLPSTQEPPLASAVSP